ncbi:DUF4175 family protein [Roseimaritima ulvae]|uniref:Uncharacterized protein n=1 Tax=Roseimaritima ulvae TaxID=980254 RepID=A0A5B9QZR7_9BACT|nr:DUF4175 family protein [Roseimaritima ulvae]QEG43602.1 hypothetical protein UC8_56530 [Roseimaritima ulvae]
MNLPTVSHDVAQRFHSLRRRYLLVDAAIAVLLAATAMCGLWMLLATGDYLWEWSLLWRAIGISASGFAILAWLSFRIIRAFRRTRQRSFAQRIETVFGDFGQRIRTVLDCVEGRVQGPQAMLAALGHQTLGRWETLAPSTLIPSRTLAMGGGICLLAAAAIVSTFLAGGPWRTALLRSLGSDLPYTTLSVTPGDTRVLEDTPLTVSLELSGRLNRTVAIRYRERTPHDPSENSDADATVASWMETELLPLESQPHRFEFDLGKLKQDVEYQFLTNIGNTRVFLAEVQPLIEAQRIETTVQPPTYTRLQPRTFTSNEVTVLERSEVTVTIETNHPLDQAQLAIGPKRSQLHKVDLQPSDDPKQWSFTLPSEEPLYWKFSGQGPDQTPMHPVVGRLRVRSDAAPRIAWRDPVDEIRAHTLAELPMRAHVADDFGIQQTAIVFQLGDEDEYVLTDWSAEAEKLNQNQAQNADDEASPSTTRLRLEEILPLESFALTERDYISYYAYAIDNRQPQPQRSETDIRYIDIRPLRQFFSESDLMPNEDGGGGGLLVQLDEIIRRQRFMINRTRRLTRLPADQLSSQLNALDRMVESQSELASLTRFLAEFLLSRGNDDVEALNQAEAAMLQAADSLAAGSFDLSLAQQQDALRALAEARRTLEIVLSKRRSQAQQRQLQNFAQQLRQKLRRQRDQTEQEIADSLKQLAADQTQLSKMAQQRLQPSSCPAGTQGGSNTGATPNPAMNAEATGTGTIPNPESPKEASTNKLPNRIVAAGRKPSGSAAPDGLRRSAKTETYLGMVPKSEDDSLEQQAFQDELFAGELDLLERLQDIENNLSERLSESPLLARRVNETRQALDALAVDARSNTLESFVADSQDAADQLREMSLQLDAIAASEPVTRVSSLRDMTTSLASMELELAAQIMDQNRPDTADNSEPVRDGEGSSEHDMEPSSDSLAEIDPRLVRQLQRRAETVEDVLKTPVGLGDIQTSEVKDQLDRFAEENDFLEQLQASQAVAESLGEPTSDEPPTDSSAYDRSRDYADAAGQLDTLYRQLVEPRLARLQQLEQRANRLAQQLAGGQGSEQTPEAKAGIGNLQQELKQEGLQELAEMLDEPPPSEQTTADAEMRSGTGTTDSGGLNPLQTRRPRGRVLMLVQALRQRIQEIILLELSADRDAPVPPQYRSAVDQYFRTIASPVDTQMEAVAQ